MTGIVLEIYVLRGWVYMPHLFLLPKNHFTARVSQSDFVGVFMRNIIFVLVILLTACTSSSYAQNDGSFEQLLWKQIEREEALEKYPFLETKLSSRPFPETIQIDIAEVDSAFLFARFTGPAQCGTHGCPLFVYKHSSESGFQEVYFGSQNTPIVAQNSISVRNCSGHISLLLLTEKGEALWEYEDEIFKHAATYQDREELPPCEN
jgi:hypothetical protein